MGKYAARLTPELSDMRHDTDLDPVLSPSTRIARERTVTKAAF